jgi:protein TonB
LALLTGSATAARELAARGAKIELGSVLTALIVENALRSDIVEPVEAALKDEWPADTKLAGVWPALTVARVFGAARCEQALLAAGANPAAEGPMPVVAVKELDAKPTFVRRAEARDPREEDGAYPNGKARVDCLIDAEGRPLFAKATLASDPRLGPAAVDIVTRSRFAPPTKGGQPVAVRVAVPVAFEGSSAKSVAFEELDKRPEVISHAEPVFPFYLKKAGIEGCARLEFTVMTDGTARDIAVVEASHPAFRDAAKEALARWRFKPGELNGRPVNTMRVQQIMNFKLSGSPR